MPQQITTAVENNFTKGLITEATALNFPENAATDADNCQFTLIGDVSRRLGITYEVNHADTHIERAGKAMASYKWNNVGGDGLTQIVVSQVGNTLYFYLSSSATIAAPVSTTLLASRVLISTFTAVGGTFDQTLECQFSDGNGFLFVYHPSCDPFYCSYTAGVIAASVITVKIRDFVGVPEPGVPTNARPVSLTPEHQYNLINQGWVSGTPWYSSSTTTITLNTGPMTFQVAAGMTVTLGDTATIIMNDTTTFGPPIGSSLAIGNVTAYSGTTMTINVTGGASAWFGHTFSGWLIVPRSTAYLNTWKAAIGNYPSNADVWWNFKNPASGAFDPATQISNVTLATGNAPRGHFIMEAFSQQRDALSGTAVTDIATTVRPRTGTWFQGRVWYTGLDAQQAATGDAGFYTWTENIYFSNTVTSPDDFGNCFQTNDPTSETLFGLLPTDGGIIVIQGSGSIYKLFPIANGMLVFAANGIWFITGSNGIGFSANDYTITKLSAIQSISGSSFVDVQGLPYFWNEEGIYKVTPSKNGDLSVEPITVGTILSFYNEIPVSSKKHARGAYHPIDYVIQWIYKDTEAIDTTDKYNNNKVLNFNTYNKAFYPYTVNNVVSSINDVVYLAGPGGSTSPLPQFKYLSSFTDNATGLGFLTFADEHDTAYVDWSNINYNSFFVTGYKLRGQGIRRFQSQYINLYTRTNDEVAAYKVQGIWDYANDRNSNRWSSLQTIYQDLTRFDTVVKRIKIRGSGYSIQFKISSVDGRPFDLQGWAVVDTVNQGT